MTQNNRLAGFICFLLLLVFSVVPANPASASSKTFTTGAIALNGGVQIGDNVHVTTSLWPSGTKFKFQWLVDSQLATGEISSDLLIRESFRTSNISVRVIASKAGYKSKTVLSPQFRPQTLNLLSAPEIIGQVKAGNTVTTTCGTWLPEVRTCTISWLKDGVVLQNQSGTSITLDSTMLGSTIKARIAVQVDNLGASLAESHATSPVSTDSSFRVAPNLSAPPVVGQSVQVNFDVSDVPNAVTQIQWYRGSSKILHATSSSYLVTKSDYGKKLSAKVTVSSTNYLPNTQSTSSTQVQELKTKVGGWVIAKIAFDSCNTNASWDLMNYCDPCNSPTCYSATSMNYWRYGDMSISSNGNFSGDHEYTIGNFSLPFPVAESKVIDWKVTCNMNFGVLDYLKFRPGTSGGWESSNNLFEETWPYTTYVALPKYKPVSSAWFAHDGQADTAYWSFRNDQFGTGHIGSCRVSARYLG